MLVLEEIINAESCGPKGEIVLRIEDMGPNYPVKIYNLWTDEILHSADYDESTLREIRNFLNIILKD